MHSGNVIVFGGTGFLGRRIVHQLARDGRKARVVARHAGSTAGPEGNELAEFWTGDVRSEADVAAALEEAEAVVNAVSLYVERSDLRFDDIHVKAAERIARLAARAGAKMLIHVSGIGVRTSSPSPYVRARARGEQAVRRAFPEAMVLRPSVLFGPRDAFLTTLNTVTRLPLVPLFGTGDTRLQPVHVDDVAQAAIQLLTLPAFRGETFELGGARVWTYRQLVQAVLQATGRRRPLLPVPFAAWHVLAALGAPLPNPPLTRDQVFMMQEDNIVGEGVRGFVDLGIAPVDVMQAIKPLLRG